MAKQEKLNDKEIDEKIKELKMESLKQTAKRKGIKREIARLLTVKNQNKKVEDKK